jgi:GNAT superfamily N-acetyltransferase
MRFYNPDTDLDALTDLVRTCHPTRKDRIAPWWQIIPTIVVEDAPGVLIGYTQFSIGDRTLYLYDTGVHPTVRRSGLGRRFMAERLWLGEKMGCTRAIGMTTTTNTPMRLLLAQAQFVPSAMEPGYYQDLVPPQDALRYLSTPASFAWATAQRAQPVEVDA